MDSKKQKVVKLEVLKGFKFFYYEKCQWAFDAMKRTVFERNEYRTDGFTKNDPLIIVDLGGNIGVSAMSFLLNYPKARIYVFEPCPEIFKLLKKNVEANKDKMKNVKIFQRAVSAERKTLDFFTVQDGGSLGGSCSKEWCEGWNHKGEKVKAKGIPLSEIISKIVGPNEQVDIVKIDIEGTEEEVIKELCESSVVSRVDRIVGEIHYMENQTKKSCSSCPESIQEMLEDCGFKVTVEEKKKKKGFLPEKILEWDKKRKPKLFNFWAVNLHQHQKQQQKEKMPQKAVRRKKITSTYDEDENDEEEEGELEYVRTRRRL